jgi:hypothetical protein
MAGLGKLAHMNSHTNEPVPLECCMRVEPTQFPAHFGGDNKRKSRDKRVGHAHTCAEIETRMLCFHCTMSSPSPAADSAHKLLSMTADDDPGPVHAMPPPHRTVPRHRLEQPHDLRGRAGSQRPPKLTPGGWRCVEGGVSWNLDFAAPYKSSQRREGYVWKGWRRDLAGLDVDVDVVEGRTRRQPRHRADRAHQRVNEARAHRGAHVADRDPESRRRPLPPPPPPHPTPPPRARLRACWQTPAGARGTP